MQIFFAFLSAGIACVLWMYLITYLMQTGAGPDFLQRARLNVLRGVAIAGSLILVGGFLPFNFLVYKDWIILPILFYVLALPYLWRKIQWISFIPLAVGLFLTGLGYLISLPSSLLWSPYHEEIGKWLQTATNSFPAAMSPFVGIGFSFLENVRYFSTHTDLSYMIARSLFSLPLHLFATFFGFYCFIVLRPRWIGGALGLLGAICIHTLYNWSLDISLFITILILIFGYMFYGWSLENGWWRKEI